MRAEQYNESIAYLTHLLLAESKAKVLIGRDAELDCLENALLQAGERPKKRLFVVTGHPYCVHIDRHAHSLAISSLSGPEKPAQTLQLVKRRTEMSETAGRTIYSSNEVTAAFEDCWRRRSFLALADLSFSLCPYRYL